MYINKIYIKKLKVLEHINLEFPISEKSNNSIHVIAGINGTGKTSILEMIYDCFRYFEYYREDEYQAIRDRFKHKHPFDFTILIDERELRFQKENGQMNFYEDGNKFTDTLIVSQTDIHSSSNIINNCIDSGSRLIYMPMSSHFKYSPQINLKNQHAFTTIMDTDKLLGNAELYIKNYIVSHERKSDAPAMQRTINAVNSFNDVFANTRLLTKLVDLDDSDNNRPLFQTITG